MEFDPRNPFIKKCLEAMALEEQNKPDLAATVFLEAWRDATSDFEKFLTAHFVARHQKNISDRLKWLETSLHHALKVNNESANGALPSLYLKIATCFEELHDKEKAQANYELAAQSQKNPSDKGPFYHGTRANLTVGDQLTAGFDSNYQDGLTMNHIYFTALVNGAGLAAALARGEGPERVYKVEPTGSFENDPNVTDKKFPGNPTRSYRTQAPLKITGEITDWIRQSPEDIKKWREKIAENKGDIIN